MKPFECVVSLEGDWSVVAISGSITEFSDFTGVAQRCGPRVRIDLAAVDRINSTGVRQWIRFVEALAPGRTVVLERCAVPFVQQLNMIANMSGGGRVASMMLPYYCEHCDQERSLLAETDAAAAQAADGEHTCPACGGAMEFDDVPESYFSFIRG